MIASNANTAGEGGGHGFTVSVWCWIWTAQKSRSTENRSRAPQPTTAILSRPAITHCCGSNGEGDCLAGKLRPGNVQSAETARKCFCPRSSAGRKRARTWFFRANATFAKREIYEPLEERGVKYAIRLPANDSLPRDIEELLTRPVPVTSRSCGTRALSIRQRFR
jgi:hypothetical protein